MIRRLPLILYAALSQLYLILSIAPVWILWRKTPPDTVFPLYNLHQALPDFYGYLAAMTMGANGLWLYRNPYTSEPTPSGILYGIYLAAGKIAHLLHMSIPLAYLIFQIVAIEALFVGIALLMIRLAGKSKGLWAAIAALTLTIPPPFLYPGDMKFTTYTPWWVSLDAVERLTQAPHHILGDALLLYSLFCLFRYIRVGAIRHLVAGCLLCLMGGFIYSPVMLVPALALPASFAIISIITVRRKHLSPLTKQHWIGMAAIFGCSVLVLASVALQTRSGYYKTIWVQWEVARWNIQQTDFDRDMTLSFLPLFILALPAVYTAFRNVRWEDIFFSLWLMLPWILLSFATPLGIAKIRLLSIAPFVPFAYLVCRTVLILRPKPIANALIILLAVSTIYTTGTLTDFWLKNSRGFGTYWNIFIPADMWSGMKFLSRNARPGSVILSNDDAGGIIPAFTPLISYFGHINLTLNFHQKQADVARFYQQSFTEEQAKKFTIDNRIRYVYFGPTEQSMRNGPLTYSFLKELFREGNITVYEVR